MAGDSVKMTLASLRQLIREEFETSYNVARASQDKLLRRIKQVMPDDVKNRFPEFYRTVTGMLDKAQDRETADLAKWFLIRQDFMTDIPYVYVRRGKVRTVYWDVNTHRVMSNDNAELEFALNAFGDKTHTF